MVVVDTTTGASRAFDKGWTPVVSPSGKDIAYWEYESGAGVTPRGATLVRLEMATGRRTELYRGSVSYEAVEASWSADGRRLAFFQEKPPSRPEADADFVLTGVSADGGPLRELATTTSESDASGPIAWSPDGTQNAFDDDIVRVVASSGGAVRDYPVYADALSWSPDGRRLAVHGGGLLVIGVATGDGERLTSDIGGAVEAAPAWSPDGRWLGYTGADGTLRVMEVASRLIVRLPNEGDEVSWSAP